MGERDDDMPAGERTGGPDGRPGRDLRRGSMPTPIRRDRSGRPERRRARPDRPREIRSQRRVRLRGAAAATCSASLSVAIARASSEPDGRVAGTAAEVEDLAAASIADQATVDVVDESGAEFDIVERASARRPQVVARHGRHGRPRDRGSGEGTLAGHDGAQAGPPACRHLRWDRLSVGARRHWRRFATVI